MKKWLKRLKKNERGLTLVELLAVVVILAIVAAIAFVLIGNVIDNSRKDAHISNAQQIISAVKLADASNDVEWGSGTINAFDADLETIGVVLDPWNQEAYDSAEVSKDDDGIYSISLSGDKCEIEDKDEQELQKGRDEACKQ